MRKFLLALFLLLLSAAPAFAYEREQTEKEGETMHFFIDPVAGPEEAAFDLVLTNTGDTPLTFTFPTSQSYEITVHDNRGVEVYRYSAGKAFAQALRDVTILPGKSVNWTEHWDLHHSGVRLHEGEYKVSALLKATMVNGKKLEPLTDVKTMYLPKENPAFKHIEVSGQQGTYTIKGLASPKDGYFYYSVEDGHNQLLKETKAEGEKAPEAWKPFKIEIHLPPDALPKNGTLILHLYERNSDGDLINSYPLILERFY
ncbi:BsuPI-related putative proteinase inhibitor [Mesobacillus foraminis]|uniref:BsuPI-related putative proteinase inhibitor n=1 Tax=Mesobacillus foraminis TaxID=279826 RepID=UPI000EF53F7B|nr:BsuPI-related putative proteinase inhibitor [Mesobacillus foraminis]